MAYDFGRGSDAPCDRAWLLRGAYIHILVRAGYGASAAAAAAASAISQRRATQRSAFDKNQRL